MLTSPKLPMKFYCTPCNAVYMQAYSSNTLISYPACPQCHNAGQLQGTIESQDLFKHPFTVAKSLMHSTLALIKR